MKKYFHLLIYITLYFLPAIIAYKTFGSEFVAIMWLLLGWLIVLFAVYYLEGKEL